MNTPDRCVLLVASYPESVATFRGPLIRELQREEFVVHVAAPGLAGHCMPPGDPGLEAVTWHDIPLERNGTNPLADLRLLWSLVHLCKRIRPHVVLAYTIKPVIYGMVGSWLAGTRLRVALVTGLGYVFTGRSGLLPGLIRRLYTFALARAHLVFFQNADDRGEFAALGVVGERTRCVVVDGSGVDIDKFTVQPLPLAGPRFLMIARLLGDKGVREYAEAARRVQAMHPGARFQLVGWIDSNPDAIAASELAGWVADGSIHFLGKLDDVRPAIADNTVYVLPSYREGTPRTVLEAMAMGRPIITTDAPGCRETVIDGVNGYLVPTRSVDALVDVMLRFIDDPGLATRMGQRSRQIAEEKYDVRRINAVMLREMGLTGSDIGKEAMA